MLPCVATCRAVRRWAVWNALMRQSVHLEGLLLVGLSRVHVVSSTLHLRLGL